MQMSAEPAATPAANRTWRRALKWMGIFMLALLLIPVVLIGVSLAINARDETLSAQARQLLTAPANPWPAEDNIYIALEGLQAPPDQSVTEAGQARVERYNQAMLRGAGLEAGPADQSAPDDLHFKGTLTDLPGLDGSLWEEAPRHADEIRQAVADNTLLLQRYRALSQGGGYFQTATPGIAQPYPLSVNEPHKLFLAVIALGLRDVDPARRGQALHNLAQDVQLWRRVLIGQGDLISRMLSISYLQGDQLLLADFAADAGAQMPAPPSGSAASEGASPAAVFALQDWDIAQVWPVELRSTASLLRAVVVQTSARGDLPDGDAGVWARLNTWWGNRLYQPNATLNLAARHYGELMRLSAPSPAHYAQLRRWREQTPGATPWAVRFLGYNPVGRILGDIAMPPLPDYILRAWDGAAFQRLVRLGFEIRRQGIAAPDIPAFMKTHPEWSTHPGDGSPFAWNPGARVMAMRPLASTLAQRRFSIPIALAGAGASR